MWFVFPQIAGLGSSSTAKHYAIQNLEEARVPESPDTRAAVARVPPKRSWRSRAPRSRKSSDTPTISNYGRA